MVKELGTFFETFVKVYLSVVGEYELVETDYPFKIKRERKQVSWSDIDVVGVKGNEVCLISCQEAIGRGDKKRILDHLNSAEEEIRKKFGDEKKILKKVACVWKHSECDFGSLDVLYFKDMFNELKDKIHEKGGKGEVYVKYPFEWLIKYLDIIEVWEKERSEKRRGKRWYGYPSLETTQISKKN